MDLTRIPNILILGFVYHGGEGSAVALPMVMETMQAYLRIQDERNGTNSSAAPAEIAITSVAPTGTGSP